MSFPVGVGQIKGPSLDHPVWWGDNHVQQVAQAHMAYGPLHEDNILTTNKKQGKATFLQTAMHFVPDIIEGHKLRSVTIQKKKKKECGERGNEVARMTLADQINTNC